MELYTLPEKKKFPMPIKELISYNKAIDDAKPVDPRKIRFRAKRLDNGEEVVGSLIKGHSWWIQEAFDSGSGVLYRKHEIDPTTLTVEVEE